jgi:hypothetical protein
VSRTRHRRACTSCRGCGRARVLGKSSSARSSAAEGDGGRSGTGGPRGTPTHNQRTEDSRSPPHTTSTSNSVRSAGLTGLLHAHLLTLLSSTTCSSEDRQSQVRRHHRRPNRPAARDHPGDADPHNTREPFDHGLAWFQRPADRTARPGFRPTGNRERWGSGGGFFNLVCLYPDSDLGVMIRANTSRRCDHDAIAHRVHRTFAPCSRLRPASQVSCPTGLTRTVRHRKSELNPASSLARWVSSISRFRGGRAARGSAGRRRGPYR